MSLADFLTIWLAHAEYLARALDWLVLFGMVLIAGAVWMFVRMARNRNSKFDFAEMFEGENGKTSMAKFLAFIGGWTATWVVVALAAAHLLSDTMFSLYLAILVAGKVASEYVATRATIAAKNSDDAPPDNAQPVGSVEMTIPLNVKPSDMTTTTATRKPLGKYGKG
jgi:hypothetical protein